MLPSTGKESAVLAAEKKRVENRLIVAGRLAAAGLERVEHLAVKTLCAELVQVEDDHPGAEAEAGFKCVAIARAPLDFSRRGVLRRGAVDDCIWIERVPKLGNVCNPDDINVRIDDFIDIWQEVWK